MMNFHVAFLTRGGTWVLFLAVTLAAAAMAGTSVENFDDGVLDGAWVVGDAFGGPGESVVVANGVCTFRKTVTAASLTQSIAMANAQTDHRAAPPWSVEYVIPHVSQLISNGGYLCNRFWTAGAAAYDWVYVRRAGGMITVGAADGSRTFFAFPADATSLLKLRFDATLEGLVVRATTDIGSYGPGKSVPWQQAIGPDTAVGLDVMAMDVHGATVVGPFEIAIDNLSLTTGGLPGGSEAADADAKAEGKSSGEAAMVPRFNPRCAAVGSKNLLRNASFECGGALWSSLGKQTGWGGELCGLYGTVETGGAWDGKSCLRVQLGPGVTPTTYFDVWPPAHDVQRAPLAANVGWMAVGRGESITLSAYLKSSVAGTKAKFLLRFAQNALDPIQQVTQEVTLTQDWARYQVTQAALAEDVCVAVGPDMTGMPDTEASFWIDAVQLETGTEATAFEVREPVELEINTGHAGNIYQAAELVTFAVCADNRSGGDVTLSLKLQMVDYFGAALPASVFPLEVRAGGQVAVPWAVTVPGRGHYRADISWTANDRNHSRSITFAVIEPYAHDDSPFGLNHPATTTGQLRLFERAGICWARTWALNWEWVEPVEGQLSWAEQDLQMDFLSAAGMNTLAVFPNPSTSWASTAPASVERGLWYRLAYAPAEPGLLFDFIGKAVSRYRASCGYWEFLNEPLWVPNFCLPQSGGYKVADYVRLLEGAYGAIKAANPEAKVIAGLAIEPKFALGEAFITEGGFKYCDIFNLHPYGGLSVPEDFIADMDRIQKAMDTWGERKPMWATETSYYAVDDRPWTPWVAPPGHFSAGLLLRDERTAADFIVRQAVILLAHGVVKIFYHEPIEGAVNNGAMDIENPFFSAGAVPKKSYAAVSALANLLGPSPKYSGELASHGEEDVHGYAFDCGDRAVLAVWVAGAEGKVRTIGFERPEGTDVYDIMGNPVRTGRITLSESPVYVTSGSLGSEALMSGCGISCAAP